MNFKRVHAGVGASVLMTLPACAWAQSGVQLYGLVDSSARYATNAQARGRRLLSLNDGAFTGSRLGFKGTEGLDEGLKTIFALEMGFRPLDRHLSTSHGHGELRQLRSSERTGVRP